MRRAALAILLALAPPALADDPEPQPEPVAPARIRVKLDGDGAVLEVRYAVRLRARHFPAGELVVDLPRHGVVTGATVTIDGIAHRLALMPAALASEAEDRVQHGTAGTPAWGAIVYGEQGHANVDVIAPRAGRAIVDVEVAAPTCLYRDMRYLAVPGAWNRDEGAPGLDQTCDGDGLGGWLRVGPDELSQRPSGDARIVTRADRLHVAGADFARAELELARQLADVPRDLHTALVIDGSRSLDDADRATQAALVASYLAQAPRTQVQVIAVARRARALLPGWDDSGTAAPRVARELRALVPSNGSNLDAGLAEAAGWLASVHGTRRVVVLTDERLADRLRALGPVALARLLPAGTLVHVVALSSGPLVRDDRAPLAPLAATTGGELVRGGTDERGRVDARELVRPIAIDHVAVTAVDWTPLAVEGTSACHDRLAEGTSCAWWGQGTAASGTVVIEGDVWGTHLRRVISPDFTQARAVARELSVAATLDDALRAGVEREAHAVNATWSLFARWGGNGGYGEEDDAYGNLYGGLCGCDDDGAMSGGFGYPPAPETRDLRAQLAPAIAACHAGAAHLAIDVELTREEIVDVGVHGGSAAQRACVTEAVWSTNVALAAPREHDTAHLTF